MNKTILFVAAVGIAAWLGACVAQPNAGCPVLSDSLNTGGAYWGQYTLVDAGTGSCGAIAGEVFGFQKYKPPGATEARLAYRVEGIGNELAYNGRVDSNEADAEKANGFGTIAEFPSADGYCEVTDFVPAQQTFDPVPAVPLADGGEIAALPELFKRYDWSKLRTLATINAPGTAFAGTLSYTEDTCHAVYNVVGIFPAAECDPTKNDDTRHGYNIDCDPKPITATDLGVNDAGFLPDGGTPDLSHSLGSGINPTFSTTDKPLTCEVEPTGNSSLGGYCRVQLTAEELGKL